MSELTPLQKMLEERRAATARGLEVLARRMFKLNNAKTDPNCIEEEIFRSAEEYRAAEADVEKMIGREVEVWLQYLAAEKEAIAEGTTPPVRPDHLESPTQAGDWVRSKG